MLSVVCSANEAGISTVFRKEAVTSVICPSLIFSSAVTMHLQIIHCKFTSPYVLQGSILQRPLRTGHQSSTGAAAFAHGYLSKRPRFCIKRAPLIQSRGGGEFIPPSGRGGRPSGNPGDGGSKWDPLLSDQESILNCPVPLDQQPVNEYQNLMEMELFKWVALGPVNYGLRLGAVGIVFSAIIGWPVSSITFDPEVSLLQWVARMHVECLLATCHPDRCP